MFVLKIFVLYDNLTRVQLCNTYVENILCLISYSLTSIKIFSNENFPNYGILSQKQYCKKQYDSY